MWRSLNSVDTEDGLPTTRVVGCGLPGGGPKFLSHYCELGFFSGLKRLGELLALRACSPELRNGNTTDPMATRFDGNFLKALCGLVMMMHGAVPRRRGRCLVLAPMHTAESSGEPRRDNRRDCDCGYELASSLQRPTPALTLLADLRVLTVFPSSLLASFAMSATVTCRNSF